MDLAETINQKYKQLSKGQKLIATFIMDNYDKAAFMTASKLGKTAGVSESTVVRFADTLGYTGYPELQRALQDMVRTKLTTAQRIELASGMSDADILGSVLKTDVNNLRSTTEELDPKVFMNVVRNIVNAKSIYIMGMRSTAPLAQFLGYYFAFMFDNVKVVTSGVNDVFEQIIHIKEGDFLMGISFPRYAKRTMEVMEYAKERGAITAALTDSPLAPLTQYADDVLIAKNDMASFVDSLTAPLSIINALIVAVGMKQKSELSTDFLELEKVWEEHHIYLDKEGNK